MTSFKQVDLNHSDEEKEVETTPNIERRKIINANSNNYMFLFNTSEDYVDCDSNCEKSSIQLN